jgi:AraC family transcriptional regulator
MRVELFPPDSDTAPRHWVRHDQAFAIMLGPGSIEWGSKRSALEKFDYAACNLALCHRHEGEWVGLTNVPHLQLGISDTALMAASDEPYGEIELRPRRKFADSRLGALAAAVHAEMVAGFPSGRLFLDSVEQAMAVALVSGHAVRHCPVQISRGGCGISPTGYRQDFLGYEATCVSEICSEQTRPVVVGSQPELHSRSNGASPRPYRD